jgi:hypothetical protein
LLTAADVAFDFCFEDLDGKLLSFVISKSAHFSAMLRTFLFLAFVQMAVSSLSFDANIAMSG